MHHTKTSSQINNLVFALLLNCLHNSLKANKAFVGDMLTNNDFSKHYNQISKVVFHASYFINISKNKRWFCWMIKPENDAVTLLSHFAPQHLLQLPTNYSHGIPLKKLLSPFHSGKNKDRGRGPSNILNTCNSQW